MIWFIGWLVSVLVALAILSGTDGDDDFRDKKDWS